MFFRFRVQFLTWRHNNGFFRSIRSKSVIGHAGGREADALRVVAAVVDVHDGGAAGERKPTLETN